MLDSLPLSTRMRPTSLQDYVGQSHLLAPGKPLYSSAISEHKLHSMILWGPPGVGKTTLAKLLAHQVDSFWCELSAVMHGVKDIRQLVANTQKNSQSTLIFVDEVHRFNKAQQDALLPFIENAAFTFIGATTENPSFELVNALLSRCRVYKLQSLSDDELSQCLERALADPIKGLGSLNLSLSPQAKNTLIHYADGDARRLLNYLEQASDFAQIDQSSQQAIIDQAILDELFMDQPRRFDKKGDYFYDQISALHKSVRGSDPDAALYWFARMLDGGVDPLYLARRLVRMASEDIGNADPKALTLALDAYQVQERLGSPEGELALAQAVVYLSVAAKSNATYVAFKQAMSDITHKPSYDVPLHLRNAPTTLMKEFKHGDGYRYAHDEQNSFAAGECYFPKPLTGTQYYFPLDHGLEIKIKEKLNYLKSLNQKSTQKRYK